MDVSSQAMSYMLELVDKLLKEPDHDLKRKSTVLMQPDCGIFPACECKTTDKGYLFPAVNG
jgi:hypothetical protein